MGTLSATFPLAVRSRRACLPDGLRPATIGIGEDGRIARVGPYDDVPAGTTLDDAGDAVLLPGLVETHAHVNEPGRTEWEGFETATRAAAAGGITTLVDMPLNSIPPTTSVAGLHAKAHAARGHCHVDYGFWGGVVPGNTGELAPLVAQGALGFKAFLVDSGVDEFPMATERDLRAAMPVLAKLGVPLLAHAELAGPAPAEGDPRAYHAYLASRPRDWENRAVRLLVRLARETGCRVHIVHLSSSDALEDIASAKREGLAVTAETCPHYLVFCAEEIPDGATHFKCAPPIREKENREKLWEGLRAGTIDFIVSDHSPCTPALKKTDTGDFARAWGGISSLQLGLGTIWTEASRRGFSIGDVARWLSERPAAFAGLARKKGALRESLDADLVVWDPEVSDIIREGTLHHRHKLTPYLGRAARGRVCRTYVRGRLVYDGGIFRSGAIGEPVTGANGKREGK